MDNECEGCGKQEPEIKGEAFFVYICSVCKEPYTLCDTCYSVALKVHKCFECLNDEK